MKFPVDKTLFSEAMANERCSGAEEGGWGGGREKRMTRGRVGLIASLIPPLPSLSRRSHLLQQMRKLDVTPDTFIRIFCREKQRRFHRDDWRLVTPNGDKPRQDRDLGHDRCLLLERR